MKAPDKIYVREYPNGSFNPAWETKRKDDPTIVLHEYINKDVLSKWLKEKVEWYEGTELTEVYQNVIDKLNKM